MYKLEKKLDTQSTDHEPLSQEIKECYFCQIHVLIKVDVATTKLGKRLFSICFETIMSVMTETIVVQYTADNIYCHMLQISTVHDLTVNLLKFWSVQSCIELEATSVPLAVHYSS